MSSPSYSRYKEKIIGYAIGGPLEKSCKDGPKQDSNFSLDVSINNKKHITSIKVDKGHPQYNKISKSWSPVNFSIIPKEDMYVQMFQWQPSYPGENIIKIFHFARFDVAILKHYLNIEVSPVYCTKIASKLVRTYTDRHGLKDLTRELLGIELSKEQQSSDWASEELIADQIQYAVNDVLNLHAIRERLDIMLVREGREKIAKRCFDFIPSRAELDLKGWAETDIFSH